MDTAAKNRKIVILAAATLVVVLCIIGVVLLFNQKPSTSPKPSADTQKPTVSKVPEGQTIEPTSTPDQNQQTVDPQTPQIAATDYTETSLTPYIQRIPYHTDANGQPTFHTTRTIQPVAGWYIVTIVDNTQNSAQPLMVILQANNDPNNPVSVIAGPGSYFSRDLFTFPNQVWAALGQ